ncbi:MAG: ATP-dependent helicase/nuclease subunit B, partial [Myxococcota bacterium]
GDWAPMGVTAQADDDVFGAPPPDPSADSDTDDAVVDGQLRAPRQWEHMLEQAAVIGGVDRWHSRLERLSNELSRRLSGLTDPDDPARLAIYRDLRRLERLRAFALPLIDALDALPTSAHWQTWLTAIEGIARQALRQPRPIHALLQELAPMAPVGPVTLAEVRLVLEPRLRELRPERSGRAAGQVAVSTIDELRGRSFSHVFIPGLQEKVFPRQIAEDPLLLDVTRERLAELHGIALPTQVARATRERVALAIAVGAASKGVVASYARLDAEKARPRVPSFYGLELLRAAEGILPDYKVLAARAEGGQPIRLGWPAPDHPEVALDDAEYDLAVLRRLLADPADSAADGDGDRRGLAHYLLETSPHLARALRFRARREWPKWTPADGLLVDPVDGTTLAALSHHQLTARSFSATALQRFSECPYQFLLNTVHKLAPVEERVPLERLDPLHRGSLFHEVQYEVMVALDKAGLLPLSEARLPDAMDVLETALTQVAADYEAALAPAIDRVWQDELTQLRADLRGSLRRVAYDPQWQPERFELSFGLSNRDQADPASQVEPVVLDTGLQLRGSIDLVERDGQGHRRATDYKTGKPKGDSQTVIAGGSILQPVLYALALEKLMPEATVESGRLYYSTERAGYVERVIPLDDVAREAAEKVTLAVDEALRTGHFPAHPRPLKYRGHACRWCDYRVVCGPHVPSFVKKKRADPRLIPLLQLRDEP